MTYQSGTHRERRSRTYASASGTGALWPYFDDLRRCAIATGLFEVANSTPTEQSEKNVFGWRISLVRTRKRGVAERTSHASGAGGRWFESSHPDQCLQGAAFPGSLFSFGLRSRSVSKSSLIGSLESF